MEDYSFENEKTDVCLVDYLGLDEEEQVEDSSGITQVCMERDVGDDPSGRYRRPTAEEPQHVNDTGCCTLVSVLAY